MMNSNNQTVYLDLGVLSRLRGNSALDQYTLIFSDALLLDLKNSSMPELELDYLKKQNALYVRKNASGLETVQVDPFEVFEQVCPLEMKAMAPLLSILNGGGPDTGFERVLESVFEELGVNISAPVEGTNDSINRKIGQSIDKLKHELGSKFNLQDIMADLPEEGQQALSSIFPRGSVPTFDQLKFASTTLSLMGMQSNYIQSRTAEKSLKVARHDHIDSEHIAYGLHFNGFSSTDSVTCDKAVVLRDHWKINTEVCYYDLKIGQFKKL